RVRHSGRLDPDEFFLERADIDDNHEFSQLAHFLWHPADDPKIYDWPAEWRGEFLRLAECWAALLAFAEWGLALGDTPIVNDEIPSDDSVSADRRSGTSSPCEAEASYA